MFFDPENPYVLNSNYFANVTNLTYEDTLLSTIHFSINLFCFIFGVALNFLLIYLVLKKTPVVFKEYSQLVLICSFIDLFFTTLNFLVQFVSCF